MVELAADGLANKEIAQTLFVTVRTVEVHLKHAYAKLGIRSRTQLARRLSERAIAPQRLWVFGISPSVRAAVASAQLDHMKDRSRRWR